ARARGTALRRAALRAAFARRRSAAAPGAAGHPGNGGGAAKLHTVTAAPPRAPKTFYPSGGPGAKTGSHPQRTAPRALTNENPPPRPRPAPRTDLHEPGSGLDAADL